MITSAVSGLASNTTYYYRVRAFNSSGTSSNSCTITLTTLGSAVNLTPYQPSGWAHKIALSTANGTNTSASTISDNQPVYLDWAVINNGSSTVSSTFYTYLYVDGVLKAS